MSNAMKKLKLLHHLTAASASHSSPPPAAAATPTTQPPQQQQFPTPPASPVSPQTSTIRHLYHPTTQTHAHYTDVLRSARAALHTLHANQPSYTNTSHPPPPPPPLSTNMPTNTTQCLLPGGFMVLTPTNSYDNTPGLCVPASPPQTMAINNNHRENSVPRGNTTIYSSRPPPPPPVVTSSPKSASYHYHQQPQRQRSPPRPRQRLTREAVAKIGKDSRLARWERVLGYVREQRTSTLPSVSTSPVDGSSEGVAWASYAYSSTHPNNNNGAHSSTPPSKVVDRKRRAEEIATIEARNALLDTIDRAEQDQRSLWSGGSGGTNGVDEFVWSEDEDEDNIITMPQLPPPKKVFVEEFDETEAGIFEMQVDEEALMAPPTRTSTPSGKRQRPKSTPEEQMAFQRSALWGKRIVEEMPALCRESEMENGLGRLVGRRMSAAY